MRYMALGYVLVSDLNEKMKAVNERFKVSNDGFVLIQTRYIAVPLQADAIFSEEGKRFDENSVLESREQGEIK